MIGPQAWARQIIRDFPFLLMIAGLWQLGCSVSSSPAETMARVEQRYRVAALDSLMLANLSKSRVVMLGDAHHGNGFYYRLLTDFLNAWVDTLDYGRHTESVPTKLFLVLEWNREQQGRFERYLATGEIEPLLAEELTGSLWVGGSHKSTVDRIQYFADLRELTQRIAAINAGRSSKIELRLLGPEGIPPADEHTLMAKGWNDELRRENYDWFVSTRDVLSSDEILSQLRVNSDSRAVVFYGGAHLQRGNRLKPGPLPHEAGRRGFYMVHYLDAALGRENVRTFQTGGDPPLPEKNCLCRLAGADTLPDFSLYADPISRTPCPILSVHCRRAMTWLLGQLETNASATDSGGVKWVSTIQKKLYRDLRNSYLLQDQTVSVQLDTLQQIGKRRAAKVKSGDPSYDYRPGDRRFLELSRDLVNRFDAVENLRRLSQWRDTTSEDPERSLEPLAGNLPTRTLRSEGTPETDELTRYLAVNLLVMGTDAERTEAMALLRQSTGLGYNSMKEWQAWWRGRYSGIPPGSSGEAPAELLSKDREPR